MPMANEGRGTEWWRAPIVWIAVSSLILLAVLYGSFITSRPGSVSAVLVESEQFFFEVNEAAGLPVLILTLWLFYRRLHLRDVLTGEGDLPSAVLVFALTIGLYAWAILTSSADLQVLALILWLVGGLLLLGGRTALRAYWVPVVFLVFAIPLSPVLLSHVLWPLQLWTAEWSGAILNLLGFESLVQGDQILRPENTFVVIETCSGVRAVVTLLMLTILLIDLFERRGIHAILLLLLAPVVALVMNLVRVITLVLNPHSDVVSIHNLQGIGMLLVGLTVIYLLDLLIERIRHRLANESEFEFEARAEPVQDSLTQSDQASSVGATRRVWSSPLWLAPGVLIVMLGIRSEAVPWQPSPVPTTLADELVLEALGDWRSRPLSPDYLFRGSVLYRSWSDRLVDVAGTPVELFVGISDLSQRRFAVFSPRLPWPGSGWERILESEVEHQEDGGSLRRVRLKRGAKQVLSYSWYEGGKGFFIELLRHWLAMERSPFARSAPVLAIRISIPTDRGMTKTEAQRLFERMQRRIAPVVDDVLNGTVGSAG